jgi:hypothetical protein
MSSRWTADPAVVMPLLARVTGRKHWQICDIIIGRGTMSYFR